MTPDMKRGPAVAVLMALAAVDPTVKAVHAGEAQPTIAILRDEYLSCHRPDKTKGR